MEPQPNQAQQDANQLQLLSVFHYVLAGLNAFCLGTFPLLYAAFGIAMLANPQLFEGGREPPPPPVVGGLVTAFGVGLALIGWGFGVALFVAARSLQQRRRYWFCFVVAALICLSAPLGTVLGVFTLIVLSRPSVKAAFGVPA